MLSTKQAILQRLIDAQERAIEELTAIQLSTQKGAFHEDNQAEGTKDMRATEVSYLARGLADRVAKAQGDLTKLRILQPRVFGPGARIGATALVLVEDEDTEKQTWFFITPVAAGKKMTLDNKVIHPLSLSSPLGQELMGLQEEDDFTFQAPQGLRDLCIISVK